MNKKDFLQSKSFIKILCGIGCVVIAILIFQAGMVVGFKKASFSYKGGENYYRNFGGQRGGFMNIRPRDNFQESHGAIGKIIKIDLPILVMEDTNKTEKFIKINNDTTIRRLRDSLKSSDLKIDDFITVIGSPNDKSEIEAKFIRLMPTPYTSTQNTQDLNATTTIYNITSSSIKIK